MKNAIRSHMRKSLLISHIWNWVWSHLFFRQWIILAAPEICDKRPFWDNFTPIFPPPDRFWADPFIWVHKDKHFIFVEEFLYETNRGHIACLCLDRQLNLTSNCVALERPYHLSYPFLFEYENQLYMLPETKENCTIELYQCVSFPSEWTLTSTLKTNISAVDSTLLEANGKWWLFTLVADTKEYGLEALYLYYADQPISSQWTSHPQNPIVKDNNFTRPAGQIFIQNGNLIRPSQDCSFHYGHAINFCRITSLTESNYEEVHSWTITPPKKANILGAHTWNESAGLHVTDALLFWWKLRNHKKSIHPQWHSFGW
jgi:hypothetical protein